MIIIIFLCRSDFLATRKRSNKKPDKKTNVKTTKIKNENLEHINLKNQAIAILTFAFSVFLLCLIFIPGENIWNISQNLILGLFGYTAILLPLLLIYISIKTAMDKPDQNITLKMWLSVISIILFCSAVYIFTSGSSISFSKFFGEISDLYKSGVNKTSGGVFSGLLGIPFVALFGGSGAKVIVLISLFISLMFLTGTNLMSFLNHVFKPMNKMKENINTSRINYKERQLNQKVRNGSSSIDIPLDDEILPVHPVESSPILNQNTVDSNNDNKWFMLKKKNEKAEAPLTLDTNEKLEKLKKAMSNSESNINSTDNNTDQNSFDSDISGSLIKNSDTYNYPPIELLSKSKSSDNQEVSNELNSIGHLLVETLNSFGVQTKIVNISRGPTVTRYELQPAAGVKISKITNLSDDIALNLAAAGVRIEAPIPGKAAVGVEIPNKITSVINMRELIASSEFISSKSNLTVVLGRDISGQITTTDLAKMPHLLIAGSTGSGKSVCINSFIISLIYKSSPDDIRLLMIDPKVVELGIYNGIPHLLVPVVTDPKKAAGALNWAVNEMLKRYKIFAENNVRDIFSYNRMIQKKSKENIENKSSEQEDLKTMPQIVIIIDVLADLMMAAPNEVEDAICRLAQMARAAGMHLVIATQRPSVDVITGIIKANIPSRIALAVSSQIDSRTILDMAGAEKLLGRGDMLFSPMGSPKPIRVQGCYVTDKEIGSVIDFITHCEDNTGDQYDQEIMDEIEKNAVFENQKEKSNLESDNQDPMLNEAIKCVMEAGQASTSLLQRRLRLGYARAGRLVDQMERLGIVGPHEGSKPRQLIITQKQFAEMNFDQHQNS